MEETLLDWNHVSPTPDTCRIQLKPEYQAIRISDYTVSGEPSIFRLRKGKGRYQPVDMEQYRIHDYGYLILVAEWTGIEITCMGHGTLNIITQPNLMGSQYIDNFERLLYKLSDGDSIAVRIKDQSMILTKSFDFVRYLTNQTNEQTRSTKQD